jgi:hypothetical protein
MLDDNRELIDLFNKEEQRRQRLIRRKRGRRKKAPRSGKAWHRLLDRLDEMMERSKPADCVSKKWIDQKNPKGPIGFHP